MENQRTSDRIMESKKVNRKRYCALFIKGKFSYMLKNVSLKNDYGNKNMLYGNLAYNSPEIGKLDYDLRYRVYPTPDMYNFDGKIRHKEAKDVTYIWLTKKEFENFKRDNIELFI